MKKYSQRQPLLTAGDATTVPKVPKAPAPWLQTPLLEGFRLVPTPSPGDVFLSTTATQKVQPELRSQPASLARRP